jgi:hypothetical protein
LNVRAAGAIALFQVIAFLDSIGERSHKHPAWRADMACRRCFMALSH